MYCRYCGKDVGNAAWCPYCGAKQSDAQTEKQTNANTSESQNAWGEQIDLSRPAPKSNGYAVAGLILSFFSPLLGLIFGIIGLAKSRETYSGKGLAIAAIVVSVISIIISTILTIAVLPEIMQELAAEFRVG